MPRSKKKKINSEYYFTILFFLFPFYLFQFEIFSIPTNVLEIFILSSFGYYLVIFLKNESKHTYSKNLLKLAALYFTIIIGLTISLAVNGSIRTGLGILKSWFIIPALVIATLHLKTAVYPEKNLLSKFLKSYSFFSFIIALLTILFSLFKLLPLTYDNRLAFIYQSPNMLAILLAVGLLITLYYEKINRNLHYLKLIVLSIALIMTRSFGASFALLLTIVIIFYLKGIIKLVQKYCSGKFALALFLLLLILFISFLLFTRHQYFKYFYDYQNSFTSRYAVWRTSLHLLKNNWLLGIGPGRFQKMYLEYQKYYPPYPDWAIPHPHNIFIMIWLYGGLLGITSFILLLIKTLKLLTNKFFAKIKTNSNLKKEKALLAPLLYLLIHGLVDNTIFKNDLMIIFLLLVYFSFYTNIHLEQKGRHF